MRLWLAAVAVALALVFGWAGSPAAAQDTDTTDATDTTISGVPSQDIIPKPGSGEAPSEAGDRGGALQLAVLAVIVVGVGVVVGAIVRQARRAPDRSGLSP